MKTLIGSGRIVVKTLAAFVFIFAAYSAKADVIVLTNGNSTATVDTLSQAGLYNWSVDGIDVLQKQWFWYRVGATGGEQSIDTLTPTFVGESDADFDGYYETLVFRYASATQPFTMSLRFQLTGGQPGDGNSAMSEVISISNTGSAPLDYHFYQYGDFNLDPAHPAADTVVYPFPNEAQQSNPNSAAFDCGVVPTPSHHQADLVSNAPTNALTSLNDASPTTLNDVNGPLTGDAAWANEWDVTIQPGDTFQVSVNKKVTVAQPTGPGQICVHKFYDANADTIDNDGQSVVDWRFNLTGVDGSGNCITKKGYTDSNGNVCFTNLPPGNYTVAEVMPSKGSWVATTAAKVCTNLTAGQNLSLSFGNACLGDGEAVPKTTWCKSSAQSVLTTNDFAALTALCLRNADGSNRDFTGSLSANNAAYSSWVRGQNNINMAYSLSVELATMVLSVRQGYVTNADTEVIYAPGAGNRGINNNFITVNDLITAANNALCADGNTPCGDSNRYYQDALDDALDKANNNEDFVQAEPCDVYVCPGFQRTCNRNDGHHNGHHDDNDGSCNIGWGWK